jgi:quercetin dioxygenase-like cupin family protein
MKQAVRVSADQTALEGWSQPGRGSLRWHALMSNDLTPTDTFTCGLTVLSPGQDFTLHRHPQPELYLGLTGQATVMIDGTPHLLAPGVALYIPGGALHGLPPVTETLTFYYVFATDGFAEIAYDFPHERAAHD